MDKKAIGSLLDPTAYTGRGADMAREGVAARGGGIGVDGRKAISWETRRGDT